MTGFAWLPPDDSDRLEEEQDWIEEHGPIGLGVPLTAEQHAAMLDVPAGDDDGC